MTYFLDKTNYKNFGTYERNRLPARSYFIPFSRRSVAEGSVPSARFRSDRVKMLSGEWQFRYYPKISELPDKIQTDEIVFDNVAIPSDWQRTGYEPPVYINARYPFKLDPPNFPEDCSCGLYRKNFDADDAGASRILTFLGVAAGFDVYINGRHAGYGEGSHNTSEFDISEFVRRGENELLVTVYKWTNGSYLECQDMFRENGIFRDVYITKLMPSRVYDYEVKTAGIQGKYDLTLTLTGKFENGANITATIVRRADGSVIGEKTVQSGGAVTDGKRGQTADTVIGGKNAQASDEIRIRMEGLAAAEWSAELPNVYYLEISVTKDGAEREFIRDIIGFKIVEIDGETFRLNDKPIKILGVNRHDADPVAGYVMTPSQLEGDARLMKAHNINAVRTSHYPPDPIFLMYCDIYGLYVIDEADIETHGCYAEVDTPDLISRDKRWEGHYLDRVKRMYMRDKNRVSAVMWSLGNEAGGHANHDAAYAYLKRVCPEIPVHYEGVCRTPRFRYDVTSEMYPDIKRIRKIAEGKAPKKYYGAPYFLCEYCHAMGVGPGGLKEMTELFFSADIYLGGCIWEWADHAVYNPRGKYKYTYGGDHGEEFHDGNFCADGLVYPDRKPHTGLKNVKVNYSPLRVKKTGANTFAFFNRNFFRTADYARVLYFIERDGAFVEDGVLEFSTAPGGLEEFTLPCGETPDVRTGKKRANVERDIRDIYVTFEYIDKRSGETIAKEQVAVSEKPPKPADGVPRRKIYRRAFGSGERPPKPAGGTVCRGENGEIIMTFSGGRAVIGKDGGNIEELYYGYTESETGGEYGRAETGNRGVCGIAENKADGGRGYAEGEADADKRYKNIFADAPFDGIAGIYDSVFRAPIDNDGNIAAAMRKRGCDALKPRVKSVKYTADAAAVAVEKYLCNSKGQALFKLKVLYKCSLDGALSVFVRLKKKTFKKLPLLLRVGVNFELRECFENVRYYGRGASESLPDFTEHTYVGAYEFKVCDAHEPYIKPQDNNRRTDVRWAEFTAKDGSGVRIEAAGGNFSFAAHDYTDGVLAVAAHDEDIERSGATFVSLDGYTMGSGGNSCGPLPSEEYLLKSNRTYEYGFVIKRIEKGAKSANKNE
ncbi:MAG: hypothetical protein LBP79_05405 [Clostridiales bacterium]|jgi:beta-galactosidase|nr:hypothetical protein [Clostridiales bacterium]